MREPTPWVPRIVLAVIRRYWIDITLIAVCIALAAGLCWSHLDACAWRYLLRLADMYTECGRRTAELVRTGLE